MWIVIQQKWSLNMLNFFLLLIVFLMVFKLLVSLNHPSAIWCRQSDSNYIWLHSLLESLCVEYTFRYGRVHKVDSSGLMQVLKQVPTNIPQGTFTEPTPAMPDDVKVKGNSLASYRNYYRDYKQHLLSWKGKINSRPTPQWIFDPELNNA